MQTMRFCRPLVQSCRRASGFGLCALRITSPHVLPARYRLQMGWITTSAVGAYLRGDTTGGRMTHMVKLHADRYGTSGQKIGFTMSLYGPAWNDAPTRFVPESISQAIRRAHPWPTGVVTTRPIYLSPEAFNFTSSGRHML